jgi:hypothetical protein
MRTALSVLVQVFNIMPLMAFGGGFCAESKQ